MRLTRRIRIQLAVFAVVSLVAGAVMVFGYMKVARPAVRRRATTR